MEVKHFFIGMIIIYVVCLVKPEPTDSLAFRLCGKRLAQLTRELCGDCKARNQKRNYFRRLMGNYGPSGGIHGLLIQPDGQPLSDDTIVIGDPVPFDQLIRKRMDYITTCCIEKCSPEEIRNYCKKNYHC